MEGNSSLNIYITHLESGNLMGQDGARWDRLVDGPISGSYQNGILCMSGFDSSSYFATKFVGQKTKKPYMKFYKQK
jgi:hypothetical protein